MAFATRYIMYFKDDYGASYEVAIQQDGWTQTAVELIAAATPLKLSFDFVDPFYPIKTSTLTIKFIWNRLAYPAGFGHLYSDPDKTYKVVARQTSAVPSGVESFLFTGWILPEEYQEYFSEEKPELTLRVTDGLSLLKNTNIGSDFYSGIYSRGCPSINDFIKEAINAIGIDTGNLKYRTDVVPVDEDPATARTHNLVFFSRSAFMASDYESKSYFDALVDLLGSFGYILSKWRDSWFIQKPTSALTESTTFQDGYVNNVTHVIPCRRKINIPITNNPELDFWLTAKAINRSEFIRSKPKYTEIKVKFKPEEITNLLFNGNFSDFTQNSTFVFSLGNWDIVNMEQGLIVDPIQFDISTVTGATRVRMWGDAPKVDQNYIQTVLAPVHPISNENKLILRIDWGRFRGDLSVLDGVPVNIINSIPGGGPFNPPKIYQETTNTWINYTVSAPFSFGSNTAGTDIETVSAALTFYPFYGAGSVITIQVFRRTDTSPGMGDNEYQYINSVILDSADKYYNGGDGAIDKYKWIPKNITSYRKSFHSVKQTTTPYYGKLDKEVAFAGLSMFDKNTLYNNAFPLNQNIITQFRRIGINESINLAEIAGRDELVCTGQPISYTYEATVISHSCIPIYNNVFINGIPTTNGVESFMFCGFDFDVRRNQQRVKLSYMSNRKIVP